MLLVLLTGNGSHLAGLLGVTLEPSQATRRVETSPASLVPASDAGPLSIVVLPFTDLAGNSPPTYLADGVTASVTADLSRIRNAFVVNVGTAMAYRDKPLTARQVGEQLGVRYVLQGNVQRSSERTRINAQLADAATNEQLWSESFEGDSGDLFGLQDRVTTRISNSMGRELVVRAARESEKRPGSPTVSDLLLRARALELKTQTLANWQQVESLYRQVLAADAANIGAQIGLALSLAVQVANFDDRLSGNTQRDKLSEAFELVSRAKGLEHDNPTLHRAMAVIAAKRGDWDEALRAAETRVALEPKSPGALNSLGVIHYWRVEPKAALELLQKAVDLDPRIVSDALLVNLAKVELMLGNYDAAIAWQLKAQGSDTALTRVDPTLPVAYALKGDSVKAKAAANAMLRAAPDFSVSSETKSLKDRPAAYQAYHERVIVPAMRSAGLPE